MALSVDTPPVLPLRIIVVEDNPVDVYLIRWVLTAHELPHYLQVIDNADHAMNYLDDLAQQDRRMSPTIMLLDLNLPQRDGRELLQRVRSIPEGTDMQVVIVTGSNNPADRRETLAMGADAYFVKPSHLNEFMQLGNLIKHLACDHPRSQDSSSTI
jgi:two-component system, chemotaxis family, response regulator Rcp1